MQSRCSVVCLAFSAALVACKGAPGGAGGAAAARPAATTPFSACDFSRLTAPEKEALGQLGIMALGARLCGGQKGIGFDQLYDEGCSMEIGAGSRMNFAALKGQIQDPRKHPDYDFEFRPQPSPAELLFTSRKPGQASFLSDGHDAYCNLAGQAAKQPAQRIGSHSELSPPKPSPGD